MNLFRHKMTDEAQRLYKLLEANSEHIEINSDKGTIRLRLENPATLSRVLDAMKKFYAKKND